MEYGFAYTVCRRAVFYYGNGPAWKLKRWISGWARVPGVDEKNGPKMMDKKNWESLGETNG